MNNVFLPRNKMGRRKIRFSFTILLLLLFFSHGEKTIAQDIKLFNVFGSYSADQGNDILSDERENIFVTGYFSDTMMAGTIQLVSKGGFDIFLMKLDSAGDVRWAVSYGGPYEDQPLKMDLAADGSILLTGYFNDSCDFITQKKKSFGTQDMFVARIDSSDGIPLWVQTAGTKYRYTKGSAICEDNEGHILAGGTFEEKCFFGSDSVVSNGSLDFFIAKYQNDGKLLWVKNYGGSGIDDINGISSDAEQNIFICGSFEDSIKFSGNTVTSKGLSDLLWGKLDSNGNPVWINSAGSPGPDHSWGIAALADGKFYLTAWFTDTLNIEGAPLSDNGNGDILVARFLADGKLDWVYSGYNKNAPDYVQDIVVDKEGSVYIAGLSNFYVERLEEPGGRIEQSNTLSRCPYGDMVVIKYDSTGNMQWMEHTLGNNMNMAEGVAIDNRGNCYATGYFADSLFFYDEWRVGNGGSDIWILKFSDNTFSVSADLHTTNELSATLYPNPVSSTARLRVESAVTTNAEISILDLSGRVIQHYNSVRLKEGVTILPLKFHLPSGFYLLNIKQKDRTTVLKFIIQ